MPFEEIPRAQGPFRSGQDNQEPIYDASRVKMGVDVYSNDRVTLEDIEGGGNGKKPRKGSRIRDILQRHIDTAMGTAGNVPQWITAFLDRMDKLFTDMVFNFTLNSYLDGGSI